MDIHIQISEMHVHLDGISASGSIAEQIEKGITNAILLAQDANKIAFHVKNYAEGKEQVAVPIVKAIQKVKNTGKACIKTCACGKEFKANSNRQMKCDECRNTKGKKQPIQDPYEKAGEQILTCTGKAMNKCQECGQMFEPVRSALEKFCSPLCKQYFTKRYNKEWYQKHHTKTATVVSEKQTDVPKIETKGQIIEKPVRQIPSGMSGVELQKMIKDEKQK